MIERTRFILAKGKEMWAPASRWLAALEKVYQASGAKWTGEFDSVSFYSCPVFLIL